MWTLFLTLISFSVPDLGMIVISRDYASFEACNKEQLGQVAEFRDYVLDGTFNAVCVEKK